MPCEIVVILFECILNIINKFNGTDSRLNKVSYPIWI